MTNGSSGLARIQSHPFVERLRQSFVDNHPLESQRDDSTRQAAILLVLRADDIGEPELLMIKRAEFESDPWSGHVACPGGRMESGDQDLAATAIRETLEETGLRVDEVGAMLGQLDDLAPRTPSLPPLVIRPFVAIVQSDVVLTLSREVAHAFWVPLSALSAEAAWGMGKVQVRGLTHNVRVFQNGGHTVWGLTERVLRQLLWRGGVFRERALYEDLLLARRFPWAAQPLTLVHCRLDR